MIKFLLRVVTFFTVFLIVAEVVFRTIVPASHPPFQAQDPEFGILTLDGSPMRSGQYTVGKLARERTTWRLNRAGWNSQIEYTGPDERDRPCVAVIGNSYVEGFYADVDAGLTAALARELDHSCVIYNFGKSGVIAPQMVRVARYAQHHFAPEILVFVLNHGSLRSALRNFGFVITNEQYLWKDGRLDTIPPTSYTPNRLMRLHTYSALVRYLYHNAAILKTRAAIRQESVQRNDDLALGPPDDERRLMEFAARRITGTLRAEHPDATILLVMDADRKRMYETGSRPDPLRDSPVWEAACREDSLQYLDLTAAFWTAYAADGEALDLPSNYHWNRHGMAVVAQAIAERLHTLPPLATTP